MLNPRQMNVLAAVAARVLDGAGDAAQIARRIDLQLAEGAGDGWRYADLPDDRLAIALGLDALDSLAGVLPNGRQRNRTVGCRRSRTR